MDFKEAIDNIAKQCEMNNPKNENDYYDDEGFLVCGNCHERKQTEIMLFGEVKRPFCLCKCQAAKREEEELRIKQEERRKKIAEMRFNAFPKEEREKMQKCTFKNDDMANKRMTQAMKNYVDNFKMFREQGKGLLLYGVCGTGKTYAACEVANALLDEGYSVIVTNFARILNNIQSTFEKQEYIDGLNEHSLLVVDDLGIERGTEYAKEQVYNIVDSRYRAGLPMIITTNLTMDEMKNPETITDKRIYERILEKCHPIEVKGENRRRKAIRNEYEEMQNLLGL